MNRQDGMRGNAPTLPQRVDPSVIGLDAGRKRAQRRSSRRRFKNAVVSGATFLVVAGILGAASWFTYQFFVEEQESNPTVLLNAPSDPEQVIDELVEQPRWNGPGAPAFGVGDDETP